MHFPGLRNKLYNKYLAYPKKIVFNVFRHTYASLLLPAGVDLFTLSNLFEHKDIKVTKVYVRIVDSIKRLAVDLL